MSFTERVARGAAAHPWRTVVAWVGVLVASALISATLLAGRVTTEGEVTNDPDSLAAADLIAERFPRRENVSDEIIVVRSERLTVDDAAFRRSVEDLLDAGRRAGAIAEARTYYEIGDRSLVSEDEHATLIPIVMGGDPSERIADLIAAVDERDGRAGFEVDITGTYTTEHDFNELSQHDLEEGELKFGLPAALIVLVLVFGALVSAFLPLLLAIVSIIVAVGLTALVAQAWELSIFVVNMITGMGLALGIDYALFVVSRFREERAAGREKLDAIGTSGATASRAVLFSGSAYVVAMIGLLLVPSTIMRSLAAGAILVGIVSVATALTLLPAILSLLGDRVNALRIPIVGRSVEAESESEGRLWGWMVRRVSRRPVVGLVVAGGLLLAATAPVLTLEIGGQGIETMPDRLRTKQGLLAVRESFPTAGAEPALVVVDGDANSTSVRSAIGVLRAALARDPSFGRTQLETNPERDLAVVTVPIGADPLSEEAIEAVERLRDEHAPAAFEEVDARVYVGGTTAENLDYFNVMESWLPVVLAFVLLLSFVLLTVAFRSVVVSATAIALNLLSVGTAYGLLVLVFQHGVGADLLGFQQVDTIEAWVPLFLFAVLFGLSMDYQVFLLSRIRERFARTGDNEDAVVHGIGSTAHIITGAALIIVAVFLGFAQGDLVMFQQMGFGVAVALLVDATIVRSVLVPCAMQLLGDRNWYLPAWLTWIPHLEVEGEEAAPAAPAAPVPRG